MAIPGYMWIKDENGQVIKSNSKVEGREGSVEVLAFSHAVRIPSDEDTGALMGTRKHDDFVVTKAFCSATPILNKACSSGKTLLEVMLRWYRINDSGKEEEYFRHVLSDVKVVGVKPVIQNVKDKALEKLGHLEEISFRYGKIQWEYLDGNIITDDEWSKRG